MTGILTIVVLIGAAIGVGMVVSKRKKADQPSAPGASEPPHTSKDSGEQEFRDILTSLLNLNLMVRTDPDFSDDLTGEIEAVIDDLKAVIPPMMERYPGETLTYELKKIGGSHLFKIVKEYLDLSPDSRQAQLNIFNNSIQSLRDVTTRSREIIEKNETAEFKTMAHFLAGKFN